jgi:hypothetical protein
LHISAECVLQFDGFSGVGTGPLVGMVNDGHLGRTPLMVIPGGHLMGGGPLMYGPGGSCGNSQPKSLNSGQSRHI